MRFVWDEPKRVANLEKHGLDFADIVDLDWERAVIEAVRDDQYGRMRMKVIGYFRNGVAAAIFATLGAEAISIISFRPASVQERQRLYDQNQASN